MDAIGDGGVWLWSDLGPLTLHAKTRRESRSSAMSWLSWSMMDIMVVGDVGGGVGQRDGSGDLFAMLRVVFIDVSNAWGSFWISWFWGSGCRVICCG